METKKNTRRAEAFLAEKVETSCGASLGDCLPSLMRQTKGADMDLRKITEHLYNTGMNFHQVLAASGPFGVYGSLGATDQTIVNGEHLIGGLRFTARILPFNKDRERSCRPAKMDVEISLNPSDLIDIKVTRQKDGVTHYEGTDFFIDQLAGIIYALDYDGKTVLNPRLV